MALSDPGLGIAYDSPEPSGTDSTDRILAIVEENRTRRGPDAPGPNRALLAEHDRYLKELYAELREERRRQANRGWAAMMLCPTLDLCRSVLAGRPVRAGNLDGVVLGRALRGAPLPDPNAYIVVSGEMLEAVSEAGPLPARKKADAR